MAEPFKYMLYLHIRSDNNATHSSENLISINLESCQPVEDVMKLYQNRLLRTVEPKQTFNIFADKFSIFEPNYTSSVCY